MLNKNEYRVKWPWINHIESKIHNQNNQLVEKEDSFMYVPVLKTLEVLLNSDVVLAEVYIDCDPFFNLE